MLNKSIKYLIENKLITVLLLVLFLSLGLVTAPFDWNFGNLPRNPVAVDAIPDIGENQQIVFTKWAGRSPQDIEDQITYPLTTSLLGIPGVKTIRSSSAFGFSSIYIIFEENIEFYWSRSRILEKLNSLPKGLLPDGVQPSLGPDATGLGQIYWYTIEGRDQDGNVTGGWDLNELRSIQDYYVKYALSSARGVSEVASIGGFVQEYQVDVNPEVLKEYNISLAQVVNAVRKSNKDIGPKTIEINQVEYLVRGLGYLKSVKELEEAVVTSKGITPILIKDVAKVSLGPAQRRGILDKEGAEVVGGVVVARYGANPMEVIGKVKEKIKEISTGLPSKVLKDGRTSQLTIVPFYDRTELIHETLNTLDEALSLEILITILVIILMVFNLKVSALIASLLPVAVLMVFIGMKFFGVDANIVALSGIAIAIGTMVDVGVILTENIVRHLRENEKNKKWDDGNENSKLSINQIVYKATEEVSGAILTAVATTIISFIPVFTMIGSEGKLFRPLAATKTMALTASVIVALFLIPPFAAFLFGWKSTKKKIGIVLNFALVILGIYTVISGYYIGLLLVAFALSSLLKFVAIINEKYANYINIIIAAIGIISMLSIYWRPLGVDYSIISNLIFVSMISLGLLGFFTLFQKYYIQLLTWALNNKLLFLSLPIFIVFIGFNIWTNTGKEFMPSLNEGSFLLMPTSMPHSGVAENKRVLQQLDMAVANIPEIKTVVGKSGRAESALDPAPLSMYENIIIYKPEYKVDKNGKRLKFKVNNDGLFYVKNSKNKNSKLIESGTKIESKNLIIDKAGKFYRNWRPEIKKTDDIWKEIVKVTKLPGVTSAPKLQPIETRLVMLQTGMRAPMGIKVKGQNLKQIESFGIELEKVLKQVKGVKKEAVFADRIVGKPYLLIDIDRVKIAQYGLSILDVQSVLEVAVGGKMLTQTVEGRERYGVRVRYPKELRSSPTDLKNILVPIKNGNPIPLKELVTIRYEQGPQIIKSEDTFLIGYVLFDKIEGEAEVSVVERAQDAIQRMIDRKELIVPRGITYQFTGTYENQIRAEKTLQIVVPLALLVIFLILYFQFKSVATSLMVFSGILVAFAGGFIMIGLYDTSWFLNIDVFGLNLREVFQIKTINLSVAVWVGFIALFGIATDDGVVMATYLTQVFDRENPQTKQEIRASVIKAGQKRIRPCLMTTATTILALLPVLTSTGRGSDIMIPMAIPSFGGMLVALITLFVVPVLYSWSKEVEIKKGFSLFTFHFSIKKLFGLFFIFFFSFSTYSQSLKDYIEIAKKNNSKIKVNTSNFELADEKVNQVSYESTNINAGFFALTPETRVGSQLFKIGVNQKLLWFGELVAQKNNYKAKANVAKFNIVLSEKNLTIKVKEAYYTIYEELAKTKILKENKLILKTYERMALAALSNNKSTMSDVLSIRVQKNELHSKNFQNMNSIKVLTKNFNRLLERDVNLSLNIPDSLNVLDILSTDKDYKKHPLLQKLAAKEQVYKTEKKLIRIDKKPKLNVGLDYIFVDGYSDINPNQNGKDILMPKIGLSMPIFNRKYKSQYKQIKIKQEILQAELQDQENNIEIALNQAKLNLDNAILAVVAAQKNKTEIQRAINVDLKAYETGILDYDKILRLQLQKIRFQLMEIEATKKAYIAKAKIEYLSN